MATPTKNKYLNHRSLTYRRDIDGLRAIAVIAVMLYHGQIITGGFLGVDVFFVISGYLITKIIDKQLRAGSFSLLQFYERRIRRLYPMILLISLVAIIFGSFFMIPDDFENVAQSVIATIFSANNILLFLTSGYWDVVNDFKPLMHTWSLGIEEQYYLIYPLILGFIYKFLNKYYHLLFLSLIIIFLSGYFIYANGNDHRMNFFMMPARGWEFALGSILVYFEKQSIGVNKQPKIATFLGVVGLILIMFSFLLGHDQSEFIYGYIFLATIGSVMVIAATNKALSNNHILGNNILVYIGLRSYGIYMWHQLIFAFYRNFSFTKVSSWEYLLLIFLTILLAEFTYRLIETPFRNHTKVSQKQLRNTILGTLIPITIYAFFVYSFSGIIKPWPALGFTTVQLERGVHAKYNTNTARIARNPFPKNNKPNVLVIGNSFAADFINISKENDYFNEYNISLVGLGGGKHHAVFKEKNYLFDWNILPESSRLGKTFKKNTLKHPLFRARVLEADYIIFGSPIFPEEYQLFAAAFEKEIDLEKAIMIGDKNFGYNSNALFNRLDGKKRCDLKVSILPSVLKGNKQLKAYYKERYVDIINLVGDGQKMPAFTNDCRLISQDCRHLTPDGAKFIGAIIFEHPLLKKFK